MPAGRPPKPTAVKELAGNPGKRPLNGEEPQFDGAPECPSFLNADAREEWDRVIEGLARLNMIRLVDSASLASYCVSYARWVQAERTIDEEGQTVQEPIRDKQGEVIGHKTKRHPCTLIAKDAQTAMHRAAALFGFDPSSRSRLHLPEPPKEDPFASFMAELVGDDDESGDEEEAAVEEAG